jgi:hypothetical protein
MKILQEIEKERGGKKLEYVPSLPTGVKQKQWQMKSQNNSTLWKLLFSAQIMNE